MSGAGEAQRRPARGAGSSSSGGGCARELWAYQARGVVRHQTEKVAVATLHRTAHIRAFSKMRGAAARPRRERRRCMGLTVVCSPSARHRPWWPSTSACNDVNPRTISTGAGWKIRGATAAGAAARGLSTRPRAGGCLSAPAPPSAAAAVTEEQTAKGLAVARTALRCCLPGGLPPVSSRQRSSPPYCPVLVLAVRGEVAGLASSLARTM